MVLPPHIVVQWGHFAGFGGDWNYPQDRGTQPNELESMNLDPELPTESVEGQGSLLALALVAFLVGVVSGLVAALFRLALDQADHVRGTLLAWAHGEALVGGGS
jgi:hypothetical protein